MSLNFTRNNMFFRVHCDQTGEERDFDSLKECMAWADRARHLMPEEPLGFVITRVRESEAEY